MFFLGSFKGEISKLDAGADKGLTFTKLKKDDWAMCVRIYNWAGCALANCERRWIAV